MHPYLNIAIKAVRRAGTIITRHIDQFDSVTFYEKGQNDLVTKVDTAVEEDIIETIKKAYPHHAILGEETGQHPGEEFTWVIDPIDGTLNFVHGFPQFAVSIGIHYKDMPEHGVIYDPISQDLYTASRGRGAQLNGKRLRVSKRDSLEGALIATSFPFRNRESHTVDQYLNVSKQLFSKSADIRRVGSAALNLAYVAAGRLDGMWETDLKPWDISAGLLLVKEAGGFVTDFSGNNDYFTNGNVIAGTAKVHGEMLKIIDSALD